LEVEGREFEGTGRGLTGGSSASQYLPGGTEKPFLILVSISVLVDKIAFLELLHSTQDSYTYPLGRDVQSNA
jgi:hypothetical protein